ncbi:hypothetical protein [uncultured Rikenella sp.]|uniref:hypothetical protein n=1 Tax=uncultured Rikenella sp. TaxID=368003 RepID=UPI0025E80DEB|nr:hypothetical protein [uncultured Rikenella sp.]
MPLGINGNSPAPGYRGRITGAMGNVGCDGYNWSSSTDGIVSITLEFSTQRFFAGNAGNRATGRQLRCLSE